MMKIRTTLLLSAVALATFSTNAFATQKKGTKTNRNTKARIETGMRTITEDAARAHVYFLADDLLEGRRAGEQGSSPCSATHTSSLLRLAAYRG